MLPTRRIGRVCVQLLVDMERACTLLVLLAMSCMCSVVSVTAEEGYMVAYPLAFRPGVTERLSVTIFDSREPIHVEARMRWRNETLAEVGETITGKGFLLMKVPDHVKGKAVLEVCGNCLLGSRGFHFKNSSDITIYEKSTSVFVQTDKPVYKPQQTVFINVYTTGPDLRPKNTPMLVYIVDPKGSRMIQWRNLKPACCGIVNTSFPISDQPVLGMWTIFVDIQGQVYNKTFSVEKYVLPRFEVMIDPPGFIRDINRCYRAVVHARYTFGQPVRGKLSINMNLFGTGYYNDYVGANMYSFLDINGTSIFEICINDLTSSPLKPHFKGVIRIEASVTSNDGNVFTALDETCLVHRQLVSLEFSPDTKKHFKPGLPYYGRVLLLYPDDSPADNVVLRINVEKDSETVFREEFDSVDGQVAFEIPSLPAGDGLLWLDALVVSVDGRPAGSSYFSHYLSLGSWYSPSNCHLLMTSQQPKLAVGMMATINVQSTCPCNFSLHYEIMSRGNIVTSGIHDAGRTKREVVFAEEETTNGTESSNCETELRFMVTAAMSPVSRLLVYYLRDDEEGVVDTLQLNIEPSFENKVSVSWSRNETQPKEEVNLVISAKPGSCVCVATVDKSVQLLRPGYQITPEKVFDEIADYDLSEERYEDTYWWSSISRKKRSPMWSTMRQRDADYAFREAGLRVMTDKVQLRFQGFTDDIDLSTLQRPKRSQEKLEKRRRAYFPETWIFNCFNISATRRERHVQLQVPDSITTWQTNVVAMSENHGMGVARPVPLITFKQFFIEYTLPYSVIRGEQLRVPLTVFNYLDICVKVRTTLQIQEGVKFLSQGAGRTNTFDHCVQAKESLTTQVELVFTELGKKRIHAGAEAFMTLSCDCSSDTEIGGTPTVLALDKVTNAILVEPEGIERGFTYSVFFCPNERIHISTPSYDEYQFQHPPEGMDFFTFLCKANSNAKVALSRDQTDHIDFEIVLGGFDNTQSWISRGRRGEPLASAHTPNIVSWDEFRAFWISWSDGQIQIGYGESKTNSSVFMTVDDPSTHELSIQYIGFATGSGSLGEFRIWKRKGNSEIYHEVFRLSLPLNFVPGSERARTTMIADVMGPTLNNLHNLIRLPFGCGEQNMIHFAPNVYVMSYLQRTNQLTDEIKSEATGFLIQGYQRQLTYKRHDGSYSAFGENDSSGSMWLTAFVLKSFAQSRSFIYIDPREMRLSKHWVIAQQGYDGSFPPVGRVLNKDIQGGIQGKVSLTAYVVVALMEAGVDNDEERRAIVLAQRFLEENVHPDAIRDPYTAALVAFALTLRKSQYYHTAERILSNMAIRKDGQTYWRLSDQPLEDLPFFAHLGNIKQTVTSAEVEMTAYALLTYTLLGDIAYSLPIVKWLTQQRNSLGGFTSTQDTCVALQALAEYATLAYVGHVDLNVTLAYTNFITSVEEHFHLNNGNSKVLQVLEIPPMTQTLFIGAVGEGCGLMQVDQSYNIPDPTSKQAFKLNVKMSENPLSPNQRKRRSVAQGNVPSSVDDYQVSIEVCSRWLHSGSSNMAVVEVSLLTGFSADIESLERLILDRQNKLKRYEIEGRRVILYFDEIPSQCMTCVTFDAWRNYVVGKMQPVPVKVYDYYEPHFEETRFYNVSSASILARELCEVDHPDCNRVEDQTTTRPETTITVSNSDDDMCNSVFSECHSPADQLRCGCQRACHQEPGSAVCGSDGIMYNNYCFMEVAACQMERPIRAVPMYMCPERVLVNPDYGRGGSHTGRVARPPNRGMTYVDHFPTDEEEEEEGLTTSNLDLPDLALNLTSHTAGLNATSEGIPDSMSDVSSMSFSIADAPKMIGSADFIDIIAKMERDEGEEEEEFGLESAPDVGFHMTTPDPEVMHLQDDEDDADLDEDIEDILQESMMPSFMMPSFTDPLIPEEPHPEEGLSQVKIPSITDTQPVHMPMSTHIPLLPNHNASNTDPAADPEHPSVEPLGYGRRPTNESVVHVDTKTTEQEVRAEQLDARLAAESLSMVVEIQRNAENTKLQDEVTGPRSRDLNMTRDNPIPARAAAGQPDLEALREDISRHQEEGGTVSLDSRPALRLVQHANQSQEVDQPIEEVDETLKAVHRHHNHRHRPASRLLSDRRQRRDVN